MPSFEDFEVLTILNTNDCGPSYKVRDKKSGDVFIWKAINYKRLKMHAEEIIAQIKARASNKHKILLKFHDFIHYKDLQVIYLIMEYCENGSLKDLIVKCLENDEYVDEDFIWDVVYKIACFYKIHCDWDQAMASDKCKCMCDNATCHCYRLTAVLNDEKMFRLNREEIKLSEVFIDGEFNVKLYEFVLKRNENCEYTFKTNENSEFTYKTNEKSEFPIEEIKNESSILCNKDESVKINKNEGEINKNEGKINKDEGGIDKNEGGSNKNEGGINKNYGKINKNEVESSKNYKNEPESTKINKNKDENTIIHKSDAVTTNFKNEVNIFINNEENLSNNEPKDKDEVLKRYIKNILKALIFFTIEENIEEIFPEYYSDCLKDLYKFVCNNKNVIDAILCHPMVLLKISQPLKSPRNNVFLKKPKHRKELQENCTDGNNEALKIMSDNVYEKRDSKISTIIFDMKIPEDAAAKISEEAEVAAKIPDEAEIAAKIPEEVEVAAKILEDAEIAVKIHEEAAIGVKIVEEAEIAAIISEEAEIAAIISEESEIAAKIPDKAEIAAKLPEETEIAAKIPEEAEIATKNPQETKIPFKNPEEKIAKGNKIPEEENYENLKLEAIYHFKLEHLRTREAALKSNEEKLNERLRNVEKREKKVALSERIVKEKTARADLYLKRAKEGASQKKLEPVQIDTSFSADCGDSAIIPTSCKLNVQEIRKPSKFTRSLSERRVRFKSHSPLKEIHNIMKRQENKRPRKLDTILSDSDSLESKRMSKNLDDFSIGNKNALEEFGRNKSVLSIAPPENKRISKSLEDAEMADALKKKLESLDAQNKPQKKKFNLKTIFSSSKKPKKTNSVGSSVTSSESISAHTYEDLEKDWEDIEDFKPIKWTEENKKQAFDLLRIMNGEKTTIL